MEKVYSDIWNDFQFRSPTYVDGHFELYRFSLIKWYEHCPIEAIDFYTGEKSKKTRSCFVVGTLIWNARDKSFNFESCGLRYFENHINGLEKFILDFAAMKKKELSEDD